MADDNSSTVNDRFARGETFQVKQLADEAGLTEEQARLLLRRYGNDRRKIIDEAMNLKRSG